MGMGEHIVLLWSVLARQDKKRGPLLMSFLALDYLQCTVFPFVPQSMALPLFSPRRPCYRYLFLASYN